jgi:hypothetical protein
MMIDKLKTKYGKSIEEGERRCFGYRIQMLGKPVKTPTTKLVESIGILRNDFSITQVTLEKILYVKGHLQTMVRIIQVILRSKSRYRGKRDLVQYI